MTENQAIERMKYRIKTATEAMGNGVDGKAYEDMEMAIKALEEIQKYRAIGTIEDFQKSSDVRKQVTEIVDRQLVAGKNNFKETYDCFWEIVKVVQENY